MNPAVSESIFDFLQDILLLKYPDHASEEKLEKFSSGLSAGSNRSRAPVMAKAVEDTAFYIYNRLVSLNEVGGDPERFGIAIAAFHQQNLDRFAHWPHSLLASSTHDTKRSEDVRARINVLSELPKEWRTTVFRWSRVNQRKKVDVDGELAPSRNDEYLLYQTLIGTWPPQPMSVEQHTEYVQRIQQYMLKASREAKVYTSWISPHAAYEQAMNKFVADILSVSHGRSFLSTFEPFARRIAEFGIWNSISQTVLKLTCPGVPDTYQGTELFELSLVDPDNRRPVDFELLQRRLDDLKQKLNANHGNAGELLPDLLREPLDGSLKLFVIWQVLNHRQMHPDLYANGSYIPISVVGRHAENVCAFVRSTPTCCILTVVPRFLTQLAGAEEQILPKTEAWADTTLTLPDEFASLEFQNVLTAQLLPLNEPNSSASVSVSTILDRFPVALLFAEK